MSGSVITRPSGRAATSASRPSVTSTPCAAARPPADLLPNLPRQMPAQNAEAAVAGCGGQAVIERCDRGAALLLGGEQYAAVRELEIGSCAKSGQAGGGVRAQRDRGDLELSQRGRGLI